MPLKNKTSFTVWLLPLLLLLVSACTSAPQRRPTTIFEQDVMEATNGMAAQWRANTPLRMPWPASTLALGPFVDLTGASATEQLPFARQQTVASVKARQIVARHIEEALSEFKLVSAPAGTDVQSDLLLSASLIPPVAPGKAAQGTPPLMLTLVLLDLRSHNIVARWQSPLRSQAADTNPSAFEAESPVLMNQSRTETQPLLFSAPVSTAIDAPTVNDAVGRAKLDQAQEAYAAGDYPRALALFKIVATKTPEQALRAYNGQYMSYLKLGQQDAAREAFKNLVAVGLSNRRLGVKLLFAPGDTAFWADQEVSGAYGFWLQEISSQTASHASCVEIAGHTSHTGEEGFNLQLSRARSDRVRQIMVGNQPRLDGRLQASGKGWSENIVGSGTDDVRDAIDRRVEFKITDCPPAS